MILEEILPRNARRYPEKMAIVYGNISYTFRELNNRVCSLVNAFFSLGMRKGDRMVVLADAGYEHIEIFLAAISGGLATIHLNPALPARDLTYIINSAEANTIIFGENYASLVDSMKSELKNVSNLVVIGTAKDGAKSYEALVSSHPPTPPGIRPDDDDLLFIALSGGTTGLPKLVMHTHRSLLTTMLNVMWAYNTKHEDVLLFAVPPFWAHLLPWLMLPHLYMGCTTVVLKETTPENVVETIQRERITTSFFGSHFLAQILDYSRLDEYDLSSLRFIAVGGMPLATEVWRRAIERFGRIFGQIYGLCELSPVTFLPPEQFPCEDSTEKMQRLRSCGKEVINVEVRVIDEQGKDVTPGQVGEVIIRGRSMMDGYWKAQKMVEETIRRGYIYTGDMATIDDEGYIYLAGRRKDIITSQGKILSPEEIEDIIYRHPAVQEVAVIGVPDSQVGEKVKAVVVPKVGEKVNSEEIIELCCQYLPAYAVPQSVNFANSLPRSPVGKILKYKLRDEYGG